MAKKYKARELRNAYLGNVLHQFKEKTTGALFLGILAAGATILLDAVKDDETADEAELFRE